MVTAASRPKREAAGTSTGHRAMTRNRPLSFLEMQHATPPSRDVVEAWIVIILLACATIIGVVLDQAATITP
jgi:hypothetical protein